jgi:hypothetical protein
MGLKGMINREIKITIGVVAIVSLIFIAMSYAIFKVDTTGSTDTIKFGDISLAFCKDSTCDSTISDIGNVIGTEKDANGNTVYSKIYPVSDPSTASDWNNLKPYIFTLTNDGDIPLYVSLYLEKDPTAGTIVSDGVEYSEFVSDDEVKIAIGEGTSTPTINLYSDKVDADGNHKIASNILINVGEKKTFKLYAWLKSDATNASQGKYFVTQISARGEYFPSGSSSDVDSNLKTIELDLKDATADKNVKQVLKGEDVEFIVTPTNTSKTLSDLTISCTNDVTPTVSGSTLKFSNVQKGTICSVYLIDNTLTGRLLKDHSTRLTRTSFSSVLTTDNTKTLYTGTENGTTVYYFAGNATDNWVQFGGYYWRIIRTNSDGSVRLLYHGTSTTATDAYISSSTAFNSTYNDPMYVGYMYGTSGSQVNNRTNTNSSTIKGVIDTWYRDNLNTNYGKYISTTAVYCNDRSNPAGGYNTGKTSFNYGARTRLDTYKTPTYDCTDTNDKFTVDTSTGNGKLTYPIALMTADEVSFAGGLYANYNANAWYFRNAKEGTLTTSSSSTDASYSSTGLTYWWLLSPFYWFGSSARASVFYVGGSSLPGFLGDYFVDGTRGVRPAVSLKSCVKTSGGDGSAGTPYTIEESTSGC